MRPPEPDLPRVLIYVFASSYLFEEAEQGLRADLAEMCIKENLRLVDIVVDRGPPKRRVSDYPALARIARGEADGVIVVRSPLYRRGGAADRLEKLCPEGPSGWLTATDLEAAGLLPKRLTRSAPRRRTVKQRAAALRALGLNLRQIGQTLAAEGYQRPDGLPWSTESVAKLMGIFVLPGGMESHGGKPAPEP